jgi:transposase InsO family protein
MNKREALTLEEKEYIYHQKLAGRTLSELAMELRCGADVVRKWWRIARDQGLQGIRASRRGRGKTGALSHFDPRVAQESLKLKQEHRRWGADRVLIELAQDLQLGQLKLPSRSRLSDFFKERCPECVGERKPKREASTPPPCARAVHEVWQLDSQEKVSLQDGQLATICNIRDPFGAAMIASQAFSVQTAKRWRKLDWTEIRQVLRGAFTEWQTLPDSLLSDNELGLAGPPNDSFPGKLTLWLVGLGIRHRFIRPGRPTDQPQIERNHRTLDNLTLSDHDLQNCPHLQAALDRERQIYNTFFPSHASDCAGRPPLVAHPELLQPRRFYQPEFELALFDLQRVFEYLASFAFRRTLNAAHQVSLGKQIYTFKRKFVQAHRLRTVQVRMDAQTHEWVMLTDDEEKEELMRFAVKGLTVESITGLENQPIRLHVPIQLTLPFLVA